MSRPEGILHRHEDGREHRHFSAGSEIGGQIIEEQDGSEEHTHGVLGQPEVSSGPVVWREGDEPDDDDLDDEEGEGTDECEVAVLLLQALEGLAEAHPDDLPGDLADLCEQLQGSRVETLAQGGFLTRNEGVALRLRDGSHFTISVSLYERASR